MYKVPEQYRITTDVAIKMTKAFDINPNNVRHWITDSRVGPQGFFILPNPKNGKGMFLLCMASNGSGWEHVSISIPTIDRCPTWEEMCFVKSLFWDDEDTVVQFHPPKKEHVSYHDYCLHLWRESGTNFKTPPSIMVGPKK